jgi:hypothetical protein
MEKKVNEITNVMYGQDNVCCEPTKEEIEIALNENNLETRGFQYPELYNEFEKIKGSPEYYKYIRNYHANRIAFFVKHGWNDPIILNRDGSTIKDGLHRLKAAIYLNKEKVDVVVINTP